MPQNPEGLSGAPISTPVLSGDGLIAQQWALWFQKLVYRIGGGNTTPLDQTNASITALGTTVTGLQGNVTTLSTRVTAVEAAEAADRVDIDHLIATVGADSGTWTPTLTGVTGAPTVAGRWKSIGEEVFWEVTIDSSAVISTFTGAQITDMPVAASWPGTFAAVNMTAYADLGNGFVDGVVAQLPNFTLTNAIAILSGRYIR